MIDERTATFLDKVAVGIVSTVLVAFGIIALSVVFGLSRDYPVAMAAVGCVVLFVWALMRVLTRYRS